MRRTTGALAMGVGAIAIAASCKNAEDILNHVSGVDFKMQLAKLDVGSSGFVQRAPPPTNRAPYVVTHGGAIYLIGGVDGSLRILDVVEKFDPATNTWSTLAPWPNARLTQGFFELGSQLCALGTDAINKEPTGDLDCFDADKNAWNKRAAIPSDAGTGTFRSTVVDGKLHAFGRANAGGGGDAIAFDAAGYDAADDTAGLQITPPSDLWVYDPTSDVWTKKTAPPIGCSAVGEGAGAGKEAMVGIGGVLYVLGCDGGYDHDPYAGPAFSYDIAKDQWTQLPWPAATPTHGFVVAGKVVAVSHESPFVMVLDPTTRQWATPPSTLPPMVPFRWTVTADASTLTYFDFSDGTDVSHQVYFGEAQRFDVAGNTWTKVATFPQYSDPAFAPDFVAVTVGADEYIVGAWESATLTIH